jgi:hypothetical protein
MKWLCFCGARKERQCAKILVRVSALINFPPGLVYNSARFSSVILPPKSSFSSPSKREAQSSKEHGDLDPIRALPLKFCRPLPIFPRRSDHEKQSQHFIENAENCAQLAERASDDPTHRRYKRMEAAWRALAEKQDWLDGEVSPAHANSKSLPKGGDSYRVSGD